MADDTSNLAKALDESEIATEGVESHSPSALEEKVRGLPDHHDRNLSLILDIPLRVSVELGRTKMVVSDLLNLGQGSVIELSKLAGEPMEVYVNDKMVARGEAVVVNEKFGVRLTDIISPAERVEQLK
jgi:flagellar motor switch protein FliN